MTCLSVYVRTFSAFQRSMIDAAHSCPGQILCNQSALGLGVAAGPSSPVYTIT